MFKGKRGLEKWGSEIGRGRNKKDEGGRYELFIKLMRNEKRDKEENGGKKKNMRKDWIVEIERKDLRKKERNGEMVEIEEGLEMEGIIVNEWDMEGMWGKLVENERIGEENVGEIEEEKEEEWKSIEGNVEKRDFS